jgi:hypothetical protein
MEECISFRKKEEFWEKTPRDWSTSNVLQEEIVLLNILECIV